jgi:hypothetical protein
VRLPEFWKTGVAVVVFGALFAYIWFVERKQEPGSDKPKERVLAVEKAKARSITLTPAEGEAIRLVREGEGNGWRLLSPIAAPADTTAVESMLTSLEKLEADEVVVENAPSLVEYGLDPPRRTVAVKVEGQPEAATVLFGDKLPDGAAVYAKTPAASRVYAVASWTESTFDKKPFDLRDRDLLKIKRDDVRTLEITGPQGGYALARSEEGEWAFTDPLATRAGRWSVDGLIGSLESLRMDSVAAEEAKDLRPFGLDRPTRTVRLVLKDGTARTLEIGRPAREEGKHHARERSSSLVAVIPGALVTDLEKGMAELRAKRLLEVSTYDTVSFEVSAGGTKKSFAKTTVKDKDGFDKSQWKRTAPEEKELEANIVEDALFKLGGVEVQEFVDQPKGLSAYGLDSPVLRLAIQAKAESWVEIGRANGAAYARRSGDEAILKLDPAKADELIKAFAAL